MNRSVFGRGIGGIIVRSCVSSSCSLFGCRQPDNAGSNEIISPYPYRFKLRLQQCFTRKGTEAQVKKIEEREETTLPLHAREQKLHDKYTSSYLQNISEPLVICFRNVVLNHKGQQSLWSVCATSVKERMKEIKRSFGSPFRLPQPTYSFLPRERRILLGEQPCRVDDSHTTCISPERGDMLF